MKKRYLPLIFTTMLLNACAATKPAPSATPKTMDTVAPEASNTIFSIEKQAARTLVEIKNMMFFIQKWNSSNILQILQSPYGFVDDGTIQFFDLNINQWLTPTPTPQP